MGMLGKREFTERYGDPAKFVFKGQYYDAGQHSETNCTVCGHIIRYVYILKNPENRSVPLGSCCFGYFEKWNKDDLFLPLAAASVLVETVAKAIQDDTKLYNAKADVALRLRDWRRIRREALSKIKAYQKVNGSWLPKPLFDLQAEVKLKPGKSLRWFEFHIPALREKIAAASTENSQL